MSSVSLSDVPKVLRPTVADAVGRGWVLDRTSRHLRLTLPGRRQVIFGSTPSEYRALRNLRGDLKRAERSQ